MLGQKREGQKLQDWECLEAVTDERARLSHPLVLLINPDSEYRNKGKKHYYRSLASCSSRLSGCKKAQWKRKQEEEAVCTQEITRIPFFSSVLVGSPFLTFSTFTSHPQVLVLISSILPSILSLYLKSQKDSSSLYKMASENGLLINNK